MALSQGSAGGLPGLTLKAWAQVKTDGTLVRGEGIAAVVKTGSPGYYSITLANPIPGAFASCRMSCVTSDSGADPGQGAAGLTGTTAVQVSTGGSYRGFFLEVYA